MIALSAMPMLAGVPPFGAIRLRRKGKGLFLQVGRQSVIPAVEKPEE